MLFSRSPWYLCNHTFCGKSPKAGIRLCSHVAPRTPTSESTSTGTSEAARSLEMKVDEFGRPAAAVCFCFLSVLHTHTHTFSLPCQIQPSSSPPAPHPRGCSALGPQHKKDVDLLEQEAMEMLRGWSALLWG